MPFYSLNNILNNRRNIKDPTLTFASLLNGPINGPFHFTLLNLKILKTSLHTYKHSTLPYLHPEPVNRWMNYKTVRYGMDRIS